MILKKTKTFIELYNQLIQEITTTANKSSDPLEYVVGSVLERYLEMDVIFANGLNDSKSIPKLIENLFYEFQIVEILINTLDKKNSLESYVDGVMGNKYPNNVPEVIRHLINTRFIRKISPVD